MRRTFSMIGLLSLTALLWGGVMTPVAHASESDSYSNTDNAARAVQTEAASNDYELTGAMMWYTTGKSDSYVIHALPQADTSSSASSVQSSAGSQSPADEGGGRRSSQSSQVSAQSSSASSAIPQSTGSDASTSYSTSLRPAASSQPVILPDVRGPHDALASQVQPVMSGDGLTVIHFFGAIENICRPCTAMQCASTQTGTTVFHGAASAVQGGFNILLIITSFMAGAFTTLVFRLGKRRKLFMLIGLFRMKEGEKEKKRTHQTQSHAKKRRTHSATLYVAIAIMTLAHAPVSHAQETTPDTRIYNGQLRTPSGTPITTAHTIRFSYWNTSDVVSTDYTGTGAINTAATNYLGWQEFHTVTPDARGNFYVQLGSINSLVGYETLSPSNARNLFLQVDVKPDGTPYSSFQTLDIDSASTTIDRSPVLAVPSARNAELLDLRNVGTGSGAIPYLLSGGLLPVSTVPGGTNRDAFVIDANNTASTEIALTFGSSLSEKLSFDITNGRFVFSDDLRVEGDLTVTGLINGVDINSLTEASATHLKVSSGGGLNLDIAGGNYQISGDTTNFDGDSGVAVPNNATSYVFFGSGGLTIRSMEFPTDESFIPLAQVVSSGGSIQSVEDLRVLQSDNRENTVLKTFNATFENASYQGDGADNVGQLYTSHDNANLKNFYVWTTTRTALQDYDIIQRVSLPVGFVRWDTAGTSNPLTVTYRTTSANVANAKLDIQVYDTNGVPVTLSGSALNLTSATWATTQIEFASSSTWTAGQEFLIRFKSSTKDNFQVHIGDFKLRMVEMLGDH